MPKCPKCQQKITYLHAVVENQVLCTFDRGEFEDSERLSRIIKYWKCPLCYRKITEIEPDEFAAIEFLGV